MKIGILLTSSADHEDGYLAGKLSEAWLKQGHEVEWFLMGEGVYHAQAFSSPKRPHTALPTVMSLGAKVSVCGVTAEARGLSEADLYPGIEIASQYELSRIVDRADRFLTFGY
jgi:sulfur relay (sulfurtransferase) complex TusBCD TusD component (DsrE family)